MEDFAFIKIEPGRYLCGLGPFDALESPPEGKGAVAFYRNNFELSDEKPWKIPAKSFVTDDLRTLLSENGSTPLPEIAWSGLGDEVVREIFDEILSDIESGELEKSVPVLTERGILHRGEPAALVRALVGIPENVWGYGFVEGDRGMIGVTPEQLFTLSGGCLETMALAGTAPKHEAGDFPSDPKEIREHELVANYLEDKLSTLGDVKRDERGILDLGSIVHFITRIRVQLEEGGADLDSLIKLMHPTPALGAYPRGEGALLKLLEYRQRLGVPEEFGAPFGAIHDGQFMSIVAIRNVSWDGREVCLPSGVGLVRGSRFDREWRELSLKRNSVKSLLGI
ncbi:MAG: chorismate-binding protein [Methylococcales bacterium]|nr:chorismate-binding protein [Methylococcales bacterium]